MDNKRGIRIGNANIKVGVKRGRRGTISRSNVETTNKILLRENEPPSKSLKEYRSNDQSVVKCEMRAIFERWLATFTPVL